MKQFQIIILASMVILFTACGGGSSDKEESSQLTEELHTHEGLNTEINQLQLPVTTISNESIYYKSGISESDVQFDVTSIKIEAEKVDEKIILSAEHPMRIGIEFTNYIAPELELNSGMSISFSISNYPVDESLDSPLDRGHRPLGDWNQQIESTTGNVSALCRVSEQGDYYSCSDKFNFLGYSDIKDFVSSVGSENLHFVIQIFGDSASTDYGEDRQNSSMITSIPILLP